MTPGRLIAGVVSVSLALATTACAGTSKGGDITTQRPSAVAQTSASVSGYRFVRQPLIVREDVSDEVSDVTVYFRLNRRLPKGSYGAVDGEPSASRKATSFVPENERCYLQYAGGTKASPWRGVPLGTRATFALHIRGVSRPLRAEAPLMAPLPVQKNANGIGSEGLAYERRLHCLRDGRSR